MDRNPLIFLSMVSRSNCASCQNFVQNKSYALDFCNKRPYTIADAAIYTFNLDFNEKIQKKKKDTKSTYFLTVKKQCGGSKAQFHKYHKMHYKRHFVFGLRATIFTKSHIPYLALYAMTDVCHVSVSLHCSHIDQPQMVYTNYYKTLCLHCCC